MATIQQQIGETLSLEQQADIEQAERTNHPALVLHVTRAGGVNYDPLN